MTFINGVPMVSYRQTPVRFGIQDATPQSASDEAVLDEEAALRAIYPELDVSWSMRLAKLSAQLSPEVRTNLHAELVALGKLETKTEFYNAAFARRELVSLVLETGWPKEFKADDMVEDAIYVSRRRNRERGADQLGFHLFMEEARQEVAAIKMPERLAQAGLDPDLIKQMTDEVKTSKNFVKEALRRNQAHIDEELRKNPPNESK